jgi:hypothetical protein
VIKERQPKDSTVSLKKNLPPRFCPKLDSDVGIQPWFRPHRAGTWLSRLAVITNVQVQAGDKEMVGGLFHIKFLKVLAEAAAAVTTVALAATECLSPSLLGTGSRWSDLNVTERKISPDPERLLHRLSLNFSPV